MWIWFVISLGVGIVAASIAVGTRHVMEGVYVGIVENAVTPDGGNDALQVRAYVDEALARELPAPSKLTGRMFIRQSNTSVPLLFARVPPDVPSRVESDRWRERLDVPALPVIFHFDAVADLAVRPGQLVDVYIGAAPDSGRVKQGAK
jgi:HlyD family secretion protein